MCSSGIVLAVYQAVKYISKAEIVDNNLYEAPGAMLCKQCCESEAVRWQFISNVGQELRDLGTVIRRLNVLGPGCFSYWHCAVL